MATPIEVESSEIADGIRADLDRDEQKSPLAPLAAIGHSMSSHASHVPVPAQSWNRDDLDLLKSTICEGSTDTEFKLFVSTCKRTGLDPFQGQIHAVKRSTFNKRSGQWEDRTGIQTGISGLRLIARRTGEFRARFGPYLCGEDGEWLEDDKGRPKPWLSDIPPTAALCGVLREGDTEITWATARWSSYVQTRKQGNERVPNEMWSKMGDLMIGKAAEALALRSAFPNEMAGLYTSEEMGQTDNDAPASPVAASLEQPTGELGDPQARDRAWWQSIGWPYGMKQHDAVRKGLMDRIDRLSASAKPTVEVWCEHHGVAFDAPHAADVYAQLDDVIKRAEEGDCPAAPRTPSDAPTPKTTPEAAAGQQAPAQPPETDNQGDDLTEPCPSCLGSLVKTIHPACSTCGGKGFVAPPCDLCASTRAERVQAGGVWRCSHAGECKKRADKREGDG